MDIDINAKNIGEQNHRELIRSLELVSARVLDSIVTASQVASENTPEMRVLFAQWLEMIGNELIRTTGEDNFINPEATAAEIGITPETVISLALALHRQGRIKITALNIERGDGRNKDICGCLSQ